MSSNTTGQEQTYPIGRMMARNFSLLLLPFYFSQVALAANTIAEKPEIGFIELVLNESNQIKAFLHTRESLPHIHSVLAEYSEKNHRVVCCKKIQPSELVEIPLPESIAAGADNLMHSYRIESDAFNDSGPHLGIAAINADNLKVSKSGMVASQKSGGKISIKTCYSSEGLNLVKWVSGRPVEVLYFYLNVDLEGTCKDTDLPSK
jgi:hypothetical protein